jgi:DNA-directed RNA polymerase beta' subunit
MVLGLYYVTMERKGMAGEGMAFADIEEVEHALAAGAVHLHAKITARSSRSTRPATRSGSGSTRPPAACGWATFCR